jgi:hypothetical protein
VSVTFQLPDGHGATAPGRARVRRRSYDPSGSVESVLETVQADRWFVLNAKNLEE